MRMRGSLSEVSGRRRRRRGAALVLVLIFGVAAMTLITTLLSLTDASARSEGARHTDKRLHFVARYGLAMAVNEVNRNRVSGPYDPTGNGPGWILVGPDGAPGWPVTTSDGRLLGRFRTMISLDPADSQRKVLSVVAVDGAFPASWSEAQALVQLDRLRMVTAEMEFSTGSIVFDRNALSLRGPVTAGGFQGLYTELDNNGVPRNANQVKIKGNNVPAINFTDAAAHADFTAGTYTTNSGQTKYKIDLWGEISGLDPVSQTQVTGATQAERAATTTNSERGLLNQETLTEVAQGLDNRVAAILGPNDADDSDGEGVKITGGSQTLGNGTYYAENLTVSNGETLTGSGTLVITGQVNVNGKLNWDGEIIVANSANARLNIGGEVNVGTGGTASGILAIQGIGPNGGTMGVTVQSGGKLAVGTAAKPGALTILGNANTASPLVFNSGASGADVKGVFTILGNELTMDFGTGGKIDVAGSLAVVSPSDATKGVNIKMRGGTHMVLNYTAANFDGAIKQLGKFFDLSNGNTPLYVIGYIEDPARRLPLLQQHAGADTSLTYDMSAL